MDHRLDGYRFADRQDSTLVRKILALPRIRRTQHLQTSSGRSGPTLSFQPLKASLKLLKSDPSMGNGDQGI